ncbi:MAG: basic amino acid/polyamine antiporter, family [Chthoniobacter sp.]|jgi:APA family basic amino acid/polyamine antiporter|nr:basic amino acid/polyamine antiporter, family [Chthoniobacter sp.]
MVGVGVFTSLGFQVGGLPSGFTLLTLWLVGGVCALCGALAYGELAAALPRSGGEYHFLSQIYHPAVGFLAGWLSATVGFAAPVAAAAIAFAKYFSNVAPGLNPAVLSLAVVIGVTAVHLGGVKVGSVFQDVATTFKVLLILGLIVAGVAMTAPQALSFAPSARDLGLIRSAPFAISLVYVMYSYSGWNGSVYIAGEVRNPGRNLPLSLALGTVIVAALYLALNAVFLRSAPLRELDMQLDVGQVAATHIFGTTGGKIMAGMISFGLLSTISAMTWVGPRVAMSMGEDCRALEFLAPKTVRGVPAVAMLTQLAVVVVLILTATFEQVVNYILFSLTVCSFATVSGVFVLRYRQPNLPRPYRTWGYPVTPALFLAISLWMMVFQFRDKPKASLAGLATMAAGLVVYFISPTRPRIPTTPVT